ncbi:hypothetical protein T492DRAFT_924504 [Pavlovales sp. CCMP2436]|nr:hypothetical protein T492DRAFT_924504 [Pavlovales sp. CCMP2436]|eukprot:CAMPEP_0179895166 /NCGR_PEP_ID=MMETSP0982-20121206/35677_1 /TAXON_ID=483367 /ORGANISM="non described non described, Strain CCMP 2436" /LENGTH=210 /DNA_ID=CAMNT_0021791811 /DNA_START=15 /DNA_END=647 /DNA_ORIENTATION=-
MSAVTTSLRGALCAACALLLLTSAEAFRAPASQLRRAHLHSAEGFRGGAACALRRAVSCRDPQRGARVSMASIAKQGIFGPMVGAAKTVLGIEELNKIRGKVIAEHSKVIARFVDTSTSKFGRIALKEMFAYADSDGDGTLSVAEVGEALRALGFSYLSDDQIAKIFQRADLDISGTVDFEEFCTETPKTLRTNLIKLAKQNGNDLGFLV